MSSYKFGSGLCPKCRTTRHLRQDGRIASHRRSSDRKPCLGKGMLPLETQPAQETT